MIQIERYLAMIYPNRLIARPVVAIATPIHCKVEGTSPNNIKPIRVAKSGIAGASVAPFVLPRAADRKRIEKECNNSYKTALIDDLKAKRPRVGACYPRFEQGPACATWC